VDNDDIVLQIYSETSFDEFAFDSNFAPNVQKKNKNIDPLYGVFAVSLGTINIIDVIVTEFGIYCVADEAH